MIYGVVVGSCSIMIVSVSTSLRPRSAGSPKTSVASKAQHLEVMRQLAERDGLMQNGD